MATRMAAQCGLYEAALSEIANRTTAALTLPAGEQARELSEIRAYVTGVLARGAEIDNGQ